MRMGLGYSMGRKIKTVGAGLLPVGAVPFITTWDTENAGPSSSATKTIIIPTTGAGYDCWIDWGDGGAEENAVGTPGNITHVYADAGIKTIKIKGLFPRIYFNFTGDKEKLLTIEQWGSGVWDSMDHAFWGCFHVIGNYTDIPDTTSVTNMSGMFNQCEAFNSPVNFNTAAVTDMSWMFASCYAFNQSLSNFNTTAVTDMSVMLAGCSVFNQPVSNFNTTSVTNMFEMFSGCSVFNQPVSNFNTTSVTNMSGMFSWCEAFNQSLSNFNTAAVTDMSWMFASCSVFNQSLSNFNVTAVTDMSNMFDYNAFKMTTANYDALLIAWSAQAVQNNVPFHAGTATYTLGGTAATARAHLVLAVGSGGHAWTITDGGGI